MEQATKSEPEAVQLMVWAIFCGFHKSATREFPKGAKHVTTENIDMKYVAYKFEESFDNPEYYEIRDSYSNDLSC